MPPMPTQMTTSLWLGTSSWQQGELSHGVLKNRCLLLSPQPKLNMLLYLKLLMKHTGSETSTKNWDSHKSHQLWLKVITMDLSWWPRTLNFTTAPNILLFITTEYKMQNKWWHNQNQILLRSWTNCWCTNQGFASLQTSQTCCWNWNEVDRGRNLEHVVAFPYPSGRFFNAPTVPIQTKHSQWLEGECWDTQVEHVTCYITYVARSMYYRDMSV